MVQLDIASAPIEMPTMKDVLADDPQNGGASANIDELMVEHRKLPLRLSVVISISMKWSHLGTDHQHVAVASLL